MATITPCVDCARRSDCSRPCEALNQALADHELSVKRRRVYGFFNSTQGLARHRLRETVHKLTARQVEAVEMYYFKNFSMIEIAEALCISKGAVSRLLLRARRRMYAGQWTLPKPKPRAERARRKRRRRRRRSETPEP